MEAYGFENSPQESHVRYKKKEKYADSDEKRMMRKAAKHSKRQHEKRQIDSYQGLNIQEIIKAGEDGDELYM